MQFVQSFQSDQVHSGNSSLGYARVAAGTSHCSTIAITVQVRRFAHLDRVSG
jgi:hypothetical protein